MDKYQQLSIHSNYMVNPETGTIYSIKSKRELKPYKSDVKKNYLVVSIGDKSFNLSKLIYKHVHGENSVPNGYVIDHIDSNIYNNSINNLQCITYSENNKKRNYDLSKLRNDRLKKQYRIKAINLATKEEQIFPNKSQCAKGINVNVGMIHHVLTGVAHSAYSKDKQNQYTFEQLEQNPNIFSDLTDKIQNAIKSIRSRVLVKYPTFDKKQKLYECIKIATTHKKLNDDEKQQVTKHFLMAL